MCVKCFASSTCVLLANAMIARIRYIVLEVGVHCLPSVRNKGLLNSFRTSRHGSVWLVQSTVGETQSL